jgi:superfamily II helicase
MPFTCRLCAHNEYQQVVVPRSSGPYKTSFFICTRCSAMFTEPERFSTTPIGKVTTPDFKRLWPRPPGDRA